MKLVRTALTSLALAVTGSLIWASPASGSPDVKPVALPTAVKYVPVFHIPTRQCADDHDDRNCYWDGAGPAYYVDRAGNVTYLNPKLNDPAKRAAWTKTNKAAHREYWGTVWGHRLCWARVGDTSYIYCFDGHRETS
jgi:hypothetical protein